MKYAADWIYDFTPASKTIDFSFEPAFAWRKIFMIINLTANTVIYAPAQTGLGAALDSTGFILTLAYDTTAQARTDALMIYVDNGVDNGVDSLVTDTATQTSTDALLERLLAETKITNHLLAELGGFKDNVDELRSSFMREAE